MASERCSIDELRKRGAGKPAPGRVTLRHVIYTYNVYLRMTLPGCLTSKPSPSHRLAAIICDISVGKEMAIFHRGHRSTP